MLPLDTAAYTNRWRRRHPGEKALLSLGLLTCALVLPPWPGGVLVAVVAAGAMLGGAAIPPRVFLHAVRVPLGFIAVGSLPLLVSLHLNGDVWLTWAPKGLSVAADLAMRASGAVLSLLLFAATTPMAETLPRLNRLGVPAAVTEVAALTYRMLFLALDGARAVNQAQATRLGFRTWRCTFRSLSAQGAAIFVRAFDRARRWEHGLAIRGYTGSLHVQPVHRPVSVPFVAITLALLAGIVGGTLALAATPI